MNQVIINLRHYLTIILTLFCILGANQGYGLPEYPRFQRLMQENEVSVGEVLALVQDQYGYMWIGGRNGLARYNSYDYKIYRKDPEDKKTIGSNTIYDLTVDQLGNLWIATENGLDRYDYETDTFVHYVHDTDDLATLSHDAIFRMHVDGDNNLWLATREGLNRYERDTDNILRFPRSHGEKELYTQYTLDFTDDGNGVYYIATGFGLKIWDPEKNTIEFYEPFPGDSKKNICRTILFDSQNRLWVGTDGGLMQFDPVDKKFIFFPSELDDENAQWGSSVWDVHEDGQGNIWVAFDGQGLSFLEAGTEKLKTLINNEKDQFSISSNIVRRINHDDVGDVWVGVFPFGVNLYSRYTSAFEVFSNNTDDNKSLNKSNVRSLYEDEKGDLWVGTDGGGLNILDASTHRYSVIKNSQGDVNRLGADEVLCITRVASGEYWIGSWSNGITVFDPDKNTFKNYSNDPNDKNSLSINHVWDIYQTTNGDIWVATISGGLNRYDPEIDGFVAYHHRIDRKDTIGDERSWAMIEDDLGYLWIATQTGLSRYDYKTNSFKTYLHDPADPTSLKANRMLALHMDKKNNLWIGTQGAGLNLYNRDSESFTSYGVKQGMLSNVVNAILEDDEGLLWVSSDKGISSLDPVTGVVNNFTHQQGLQTGEYNIGSAYKLKSGELVFGGIEGYTKFHPKNIVMNQRPPSMVFEKLEIINKTIHPNTPNSPLSKTLLTSTDLTFNYKQNVIAIEFAGIGFRAPSETSYSYILDGFDLDWRNSGTERKATYTNLDAGNYVFRVKAENNEGIFSEPISINIHVTPPPWKTIWAYSLYTLCVLALIGWYISTQRKILLNERKVVSRLRKLDGLKDEFLANTSHELRTPLFGMIGLAEELLETSESRLNKMDLNNLSMIVASGKRLSTIVDDIMDFSQIRNNAMKLDLRPIDLNAVSVIVVALTQPLIPIDKIRIRNLISTELPPVLADENRLQQIFHNLLGNAAKFTKQGEIVLRAEHVGEKINISISDTGNGIPKNQIEGLFDAFTQLEDSDTRHQGGVGLGLAITRNLVNLHGGEIWVESEMGHGTTFTFSLHIINSNEEMEGIEISDKILNKVQYLGVSSLTVDTEFEDAASDVGPVKPSEKRNVVDARILIVDDEPVNRRVLRNHLASQSYTVVDVEDGRKAMELFNKGEHFDLVLLDVMMPSKSGYDTCREIRSTHTRHKLPVIFITAKYQLQDIITGFDSGGNDFLTKPISRQELLARVDLHLQLLESSRGLENKILERTKELQEAYDKLEKLSLSDPLTGLGNRRFFEKFIEADGSETLRKHIDWMKRKEGTPPTEHDLVFLLVDIDHFKNVNDNYGHAAGDLVLVELADILRDVCRNSDYIVRWGGEEFMVVARFLDRENTHFLAERIRKRIALRDIHISQTERLNVTCSIGFAAYPLNRQEPGHYHWENVIQLADMSLYAVKKSGRNGWLGIEEINESIDSIDVVRTKLEKGEIKIRTSKNSVSENAWKK